MEPRTVGVEEELLLVDPQEGTPRAVSGAVLRHCDEAHDSLSAEMQQQQVETDTRPCATLDELSAELRRRRTIAVEAARSEGVEVAALATSPLRAEPMTTPQPRYRRMVEEFGLTAHEQLTCGCHVHVAISSRDEGVGVLDRIRPWLPVLLALSANSPFWQSGDSGFESYRSQVWGRWPSAGPTGEFGSTGGYDRVLADLLDSGTLLDEGMVYFDARLSAHQPTVEIRLADVCLRTDDAVLLAALARALVETAALDWAAGKAPQHVRTELLRVASWRAGRSGLESRLVHPRTGLPVPAADAVAALVDHVTPVLDAGGDLDTVEDLVAAVLHRGTGARTQREVFRRSGRLPDVVADAVARTVSS